MLCNTVSADTGKDSPVLLRPHHLLCLQNFRGKGYSPAFVRRMTEVQALVYGKAAGSDEGWPHPILLVSGRDTLCAACPHCGKTDCTSENPSRFDALVLARTGLQIGQILEKGMASPDLPAMSPNLLETCCAGCTWFEVCMQICRE